MTTTRDPSDAGGRAALSPLDPRFAGTYPAVFITADREGRVTFAEDSHGSPLDLPPPGATGMEPFDPVHPADRETIREVAIAAVRDGTFFDGEMRMRTVDGGYRWTRVRGRFDVADQHWYGSLEDVHDRRTAQALAHASDAQLRALLDNMNEGVIAIAADGKQGFFNRAYAQLYAEQLGERDWANLDELFTSFDVEFSDGTPIPSADRPILRILRGETIRDLHIVARLKKSGQIHHFIYNGQPILGADGKIEFAMLSVRDVTDRYATQAALEASEARFRGVFESGVVGMCIIDVDTQETLAINDRLLEITGGTRAAFESGAWDWVSVTHPDHLERDRIAAEQARATGKAEPFEKTYVLPDGRRMEVRVTSAQMPRSPRQFVVCVEDITDLKRTNQQLRESEAELQAILRSLEEGVAAVSPEGRVLFANDAYARMTAAPEAELLGLTIGEIHSRFDVLDEGGEPIPMAARPLSRLLRGERIGPGEARARFPDGREAYTVYSGEPVFDAAGKLAMSILVFRDVTRRKEAEAELTRTQQELIHVSRVSAMGTMAGSLAHELNQPLAAVANYAAAAQMMLSVDGSDDEVAAVLDRVSDEAVRAGQIVNRLRRFITKGEVDRRPESLAAIVREAVGIAHSDALTQGAQVKLKLDPDADIVLVDRIQLQQVVFNLVRNAVEAMHANGERELTIASRATEDDDIELLVADRGPGLPPAVADRLFEPFITTKESGMGIGLPICRSIVRAHGGDIRAEPRPTGGTVFIVTLPRPDPEDW
ncbi:PAS domain S-box protein [Sphingoaurantiacus capsulatus]|uniref:histidine kinase n=1 Tax=Sphingoaurantiacus capsulatus TaxID=1771310 RepID=A0ABV7XAH7_9SPHN